MMVYISIILRISTFISELKKLFTEGVFGLRTID